MNDYLITSETDASAEQAIIVLPDIWGQTDYSYLTLKQLTQKFQCPSYMLDYFYAITKSPNKFNPELDEAKAFELMETMRGEDFVGIFRTALNDIKAAQPKLKQVIVIGFCFGGRLAYLAGLSSEVSKIVSFYGAGAHSENYLNDKTPVEALCDKRKNDKNLAVLSFYGTEDGSIPDEDRAKTKRQLNSAGIDYSANEYDAGHAYFQPGRPNYNEKAANDSWKDLETFINGEKNNESN